LTKVNVTMPWLAATSRIIDKFAYKEKESL